MLEEEKNLASPTPEYFTCTLTEALEYNTGHHNVKVSTTPKGSLVGNEHYSNINEFVDFLSANYGEDLAIGCAFPQKKSKADEAGPSNEDTPLDDELANVDQLSIYPCYHQCLTTQLIIFCRLQRGQIPVLSTRRVFRQPLWS